MMAQTTKFVFAPWSYNCTYLYLYVIALYLWDSTWVLTASETDANRQPYDPGLSFSLLQVSYWLDPIYLNAEKQQTISWFSWPPKWLSLTKQRHAMTAYCPDSIICQAIDCHCCLNSLSFAVNEFKSLPASLRFVNSTDQSNKLTYAPSSCNCHLPVCL